MVATDVRPPSRASSTPSRSRAFGGVAIAMAAIAALGTLYVGGRLGRRAHRMYVQSQGLQLNRAAWQAGYRERGLPVPDGPRDGYWGLRIGSHIEDDELGWVLPALHFPGLLETDARGMQHIKASTAPHLRLLIMGASTAFGGYASTIDRTYFAELVRRLASAGTPIEVTVYATGAWKSSQELKALKRFGRDTRPDVVLFLNGLNDVTNGSNARTLYGMQTKTLDGSRWHPLYHEHDYDARVHEYVRNITAAYDELLPRRARPTTDASSTQGAVS